jgi:hypothetical protein
MFDKLATLVTTRPRRVLVLTALFAAFACIVGGPPSAGPADTLLDDPATRDASQSTAAGAAVQRARLPSTMAAPIAMRRARAPGRRPPSATTGRSALPCEAGRLWTWAVSIAFMRSPL